MVLHVQAGALQVAGLKSKFKVMVMPRLPWGAPAKVNAPQGPVGVPHPERASATKASISNTTLLIIPAPFLSRRV
jgi:hypothetical protein